MHIYIYIYIYIFEQGFSRAVVTLELLHSPGDPIYSNSDCDNLFSFEPLQGDARIHVITRND